MFSVEPESSDEMFSQGAAPAQAPASGFAGRKRRAIMCLVCNLHRVLRLAGADSVAHFSQRPISWVDLNIVTNSTN